MKTFRPILVAMLAVVVPACGTGGGSGTLTPTAAPARPSGVVARSGNKQVKLEWTPSPAAAVYSVRRSPNPGGPYVEVPGGQGVAGLTFTDTGLVNGTSYYYAVTARNLFGESGPSPEAQGTPGFLGIRLAAGNRHCLAVLQDGSLWSWGANFEGELGANHPAEQSNIALQVDLSGVSGVWAASNCSAALCEDGSVWTWGQSIGPSSSVPVQVDGLSNVVSLAVGGHHFLALLADGTVWGWGGNDFGELGGGAGPDVLTPTPIAGLSDIVAIAAGTHHSLALQRDGTLLGWGANYRGQIGDGTSDPIVPNPKAISNLSGVTAMSAGSARNFAVRSDGSVWAWGDNTSGQLGTGSAAPDILIAEQVRILTNIRSVAAGVTHTLAVRTDGTIWAWGDNELGQLGNGTVTPGTTPFQIPSLSGIGLAAANFRSSYALGGDGRIWSWGDSEFGQLGGGVGAVQDNPVQVANVTEALSVSASLHTAFAIRAGGTAWGWGENGTAGALGNGGTGPSHFRSAVALTPPAGVTISALSAGIDHGVACLSNGTVWAWGMPNANSTASTQLSPIQVGGLSAITSIAAGDSFCLAAGGPTQAVYHWGANQYGQRGNGATGPPIAAPAAVGLTGVAAVSAGLHHGLALKTDGTVWSWGGNFYYQTGVNNGSPNGVSVVTPVQVAGLSGVTAVSAGGTHSLALKSDGTVWAWGADTGSQLGAGATGNTSIPLQVVGLSGITTISAGTYHSLAIDSNGDVWAWGWNAYSELGSPTGTEIQSALPLKVPSVVGATAVAAAFNFSCAIAGDGRVWSWGRNLYGNIGIGTTGLSTIPLEVLK